MYQKRLAAPKAYPIDRKAAPFVVSAKGPHAQQSGVPLLVIIRDMLGYGNTRKEVKDILQRGEVLVDGVVRTDERFRVGFLDSVFLPSAEKAFRAVFDAERFYLQEVADAEQKICRVTGVRSMKGNTYQIALHDGKTFVSDTHYSTGTGLILTVPDLTVKQSIGVQEENSAIVLSGSHRGAFGTITSVEENRVTLSADSGHITIDVSHVCPIDKTETLLGDQYA